MEEESKTKFSMNVEFSFAFKKSLLMMKIKIAFHMKKRYNQFT